MMLKQSSSRNLRSKSLKVKHGLQLFVIAAVCIWIIYQVKQPHKKKELISEEEKVTKVENEYQIGRKHLKPELEKEVVVEFDKGVDEEVKVEVEVEVEVRENEGEEREKEGEAEHDELQDFIDEDDKDT
ncbi:hypothetical protein ACS0TY_024177 [Phlomoides rotata]